MYLHNTKFPSQTIDLELLYIPNSKLFNPKQEHADIGTIDFSALLDPAKEETYTMKLDKHIAVQEGLTMDFQEFVMEPQRSLLRFRLNAPEHTVLGDLAGILKTDKGEEKALWIPPSREDENISTCAGACTKINHIKLLFYYHRIPV